MAVLNDKPNLILIGLSTGGPTFLKRLLQQLTVRPDDHLVIIQHMPEHLGPDYAKRLSNESKAVVRLAKTGDEVLNQPVLLCPGDHHLSFSKSATGKAYCRITRQKMDYVYQPSIDMAVASLNVISGFQKYVIILTGMGADGSIGLQSLARESRVAIAQDPSEAVAPGMPSAAIATGLVDHVLSVEGIARFFNSRPARREVG